MNKILGILLLAFITTVGFSGAVAAAIASPEANAQVIASGNSLNVNTNINRVGVERDDFRRVDRDDRRVDRDDRRVDRDDRRNDREDNRLRCDPRRDDNRRVLIIHRDGRTIIIVLNNRHRHHHHHHHHHAVNVPT